LRSLAVSPDGKRVACGGWDGSVAAFDLRSGALVERFEGATDSVYDVAWAPDGARVAAALADGTLLVWSVGRGGPAQKLSGHVGAATRLAFSAPARLISVGDDSALRVWDLETGAVQVQHKGDSRWMALAASTSGEQMLTGGRDGSLVLWSAAGLPTAKLKGHRAAVHSVAFVPGTQTCVSASWDGTVRFWNLETLEETRSLSGPVTGALCLAIARDGARLAIGLDDGRVQVCDLKSGRHAETFAAHRQRVAAVVFMHDSAEVLSAGWDDAVVRSTIRPTR
jgi:WD40 repeat protein